MYQNFFIKVFSPIIDFYTYFLSGMVLIVAIGTILNITIVYFFVSKNEAKNIVKNLLTEIYNHIYIEAIKFLQVLTGQLTMEEYMLQTLQEIWQQNNFPVFPMPFLSKGKF
jgi:hypothetical protein